MLDVLFTVDVEIWCDGWNLIDERFPQAFCQYVYGPTSAGEYGLRYQLRTLNQHGLRGVFFIEPLFALRFGTAPLQEIVGLVREAGQDVELHLHTEWVDEAREPVFRHIAEKRQYLRDFTADEQTVLIGKAKQLIAEAGAGGVSAFRAGSFAFNADTLRAVRANGMRFDSSYNASWFGLDSGVMPGRVVVSPIECDGVVEYPMTVFMSGARRLRQVQLTACSFREIEHLLWEALKDRRESFVLLCHNSELLNQAKNRRDDVVVERFLKLCGFLDRNRDCFRTRGFRDLNPRTVKQQPPPLAAPTWMTAARIVEQAYRRRYG